MRTSAICRGGSIVPVQARSRPVPMATPACAGRQRQRMVAHGAGQPRSHSASVQPISRSKLGG